MSSISTTEIIELLTFVSLAKHRSFRKAAVERGVTPSAISHTLRRLEARQGLQLIRRTTRSVSLTEAGAHLFDSLEPALAGLSASVESLNALRDTPLGTVRLNIPNSIAPLILGKRLGPLLARNPGLKLEVVATDRLVDIVAEGFDAGIRLGERLSQDMIAVRINANLRFAVVGSPDYFKTRHVPLTPADLTKHACIGYRFPSGAKLDWEFEKAGQEVTVAAEGPVLLDDQELMLAAALSGAGLAYIWDFRAEAHIKSGALIRCLEDWCAPVEDLFLYYPNRRNVSAGLRAIISALRAAEEN